MLRTSPAETGFDEAALARCIDACLACAQACTACADACLGEESVAELRSCITSNLACADVCTATAAVLSRQVGYNAEVTRALLTACAAACRHCGEECAQHADMHDHCGLCADACRACEQACAALLAG
ncbi:MAG: four-helix bundle copper-binding protein [Actinobacteria bacterium]|nr:four-helix bundle copper-binding protein [Actinomycetota bacterium]